MIIIKRLNISNWVHTLINGSLYDDKFSLARYRSFGFSSVAVANQRVDSAV